jgi:hypothetical protein
MYVSVYVLSTHFCEKNCRINFNTTKGVSTKLRPVLKKHCSAKFNQRLNYLRTGLCIHTDVMPAKTVSLSDASPKRNTGPAVTPNVASAALTSAFENIVDECTIILLFYFFSNRILFFLLLLQPFFRLFFLVHHLVDQDELIMS